jgi:hypothetical protein
MGCDTNNAFFSMQADIFYSLNDQSAYGNVLQNWFYGQTVICDFTYAGGKFKEEVLPNVLISQDSLLLGRAKKDFRTSSEGEVFDFTNIAVTNIRDKHCNELYTEDGGPRQGKSTVFEIVTFKPFINPFGVIEHYTIILKRSENQGYDI